MTKPLKVVGRDIVDTLGRTVYLRGTNKFGFEGKPGGGTWGDIFIHEWRTAWYPGGSWDTPEGRAAVENVLDVMKSWGINSVRFPQAIDQWKFNLGNHREIIKELLQMMDERGMYMIYCPFLITGGDGGKIWGNLPYPPYQNTDATNVIANEQEFVDLWASIASELKDYPNILFELLNEPNSGVWKEFVTGPAFESWKNVAQMCVDAIRGVGAKQPIIVEWWFGCWTNLYYEEIDYSNTRNLDWVWLMDLKDPLDNLIMSTHLYRYHFYAFWQLPGTGKGDRIVAWEKEDILKAFKRYGFAEVAAHYPLLIGEIGCNMDTMLDNPAEGYDNDLQHELSAFNTCLSSFNVRGYHYNSWWWSKVGRYREHDGYPNFTPNVTGQILIEALKSLKVISVLAIATISTLLASIGYFFFRKKK